MCDGGEKQLNAGHGVEPSHFGSSKRLLCPRDIVQRLPEYS